MTGTNKLIAVALARSKPLEKWESGRGAARQLVTLAASGFSVQAGVRVFSARDALAATRPQNDETGALERRTSRELPLSLVL